MDQQRFELFTRRFASITSRRGGLKLLIAAAGAALVSRANVVEAGLCRAPTEKCRKNKQCCSVRCRQGRCQCQKKGAPCQFPVFCCSGKCNNGKCG